ncbi:hypothetical protein BU14_0279s0004 [Porphyra umbilicalis]|uniref:Uncharacterized protein n=1 Tax=Porphyra umbilicalis TaxID=2786 RepID=A0A1X6P176_PORUM|nr:hypothetical protein BU14_0279s0004 [Porphyra umbilicalis]|eukprot:OSX74618.1 hypothetical protein BU14_0279s0004 [Porphyra umbilicalis]
MHNPIEHYSSRSTYTVPQFLEQVIGYAGNFLGMSVFTFVVAPLLFFLGRRDAARSVSAAAAVAAADAEAGDAGASGGITAGARGGGGGPGSSGDPGAMAMLVRMSPRTSAVGVLSREHHAPGRGQGRGEQAAFWRPREMSGWSLPTFLRPREEGGGGGGVGAPAGGGTPRAAATRLCRGTRSSGWTVAPSAARGGGGWTETTEGGGGASVAVAAAAATWAHGGAPTARNSAPAADTAMRGRVPSCTRAAHTLAVVGTPAPTRSRSAVATAAAATPSTAAPAPPTADAPAAATASPAASSGTRSVRTALAAAAAAAAAAAGRDNEGLQWSAPVSCFSGWPGVCKLEG